MTHNTLEFDAMPALGTIRQIAYVVDDMQQALDYWLDVMKAGPFYLFEHAKMDSQVYRGGASNVDVSLAVGNTGDVQIELIYCENDEPSVYREFLDAKRVGVHHVGLMPENYAQTYGRYVALGFEPAFECNIGGTNLVYFDTVQKLGHFTELWDNSEAFKNFLTMVKAAAQNWNGDDPIRTGAL
ncbi:MAG: VOC family protein [Pseudomonadales bacterium]